MEDHSTPEGLYCPECGYDLRGGLSGRCPECGLPVDEQTLREPRIPWVHRARLGRARAYVRTLGLAMLHPARLGGEAGKPLALADGRAFRRVTTWLATLPVVAMIAVAYANAFAPIGRWQGSLSFVGGVLEWLVLVAAAAGTWLFFYAMSGAAGLFFRPRPLSAERRARAVAASCYACAPLAWLVACVPAAAWGWFALSRGPYLWRTPLVAYAAWFALLSPGLLVVWFGLSALVILKRSTHCGLARELTAAFLLPLLWTSLAAFVLLGIPAAVAYLGLMVLSFL